MEYDRGEFYKAACDILIEHGYEADYRPDYSGRAMYGDTTPAIVTDAPSAKVGWAVCIAVRNEHNEQDAIDLAERIVPHRSDNMGLSMVYY